METLKRAEEVPSGDEIRSPKDADGSPIEPGLDKSCARAPDRPHLVEA